MARGLTTILSLLVINSHFIVQSLPIGFTDHNHQLQGSKETGFGLSAEQNNKRHSWNDYAIDGDVRKQDAYLDNVGNTLVQDKQNYYFEEYEKEANEESIFKTGDERELQDYYDYIDHMDEDEMAEVMSQEDVEEDEEGKYKEKEEEDLAEVTSPEVEEEEQYDEEDDDNKEEDEEGTTKEDIQIIDSTGNYNEKVSSRKRDHDDDASATSSDTYLPYDDAFTNDKSFADESATTDEKTFTDEKTYADDKIFPAAESFTDAATFTNADNLPRDMIKTEAHDTAEMDALTASASSSFQPIPLPMEFGKYDILKKDGFISLAELAVVTGATENISAAFRESDTNGDGVLNEDEFHLAHWYRMSARPGIAATETLHNNAMPDTTQTVPSAE